MTDSTNQTLTLTTAQTTQPSGGSGLQNFFSKESIMNFLPIILIFGVFYFFIIRQQIKKQKDQENLVKSSKKGDRVIVAGGIIGKIVKEKEGDIILLEIAKNVHIEVLRSSIVAIVENKKALSKSKKK
ncbi:MAG: preprotein translocase subunit YajC [Rickettsiales bacterium]|nr:preprotein translocase subunit YajC [Rickettsiales bacterium]